MKTSEGHTMKNAIAIIIALSATPAAANKCAAFEEMAEKIMENRLNSFPMSALIRVIDENAHGPLKDVATALVIDAYSQPAYTSQKVQQRVTREFANGAYLTCIESLSK